MIRKPTHGTAVATICRRSTVDEGSLATEELVDISFLLGLATPISYGVRMRTRITTHALGGCFSNYSA